MQYNKLSSLINNTSLLLLQAKEGEANLLLSKVYDELLVLAPSFQSLNSGSEILVKLSQIMEVMHDAQQRRDYVYLVDILKYSLPKLINFGTHQT